MHKRHVRWIATLAIAGTGVFTAAAVASAATIPDPRQASPATCAGLAADLSTTVGEAVKDLLATPPNLAGASGTVADAVALNTAIISLGCAALPPPGIPSVPSVPPVSALPTVPALPSVPGLPPVSGIPTVSSLPSVPSAPAVTSSVPGVADLPTDALTGLTSALPPSSLSGLTAAAPRSANQ